MKEFVPREDDDGWWKLSLRGQDSEKTTWNALICIPLDVEAEKATQLYSVRPSSVKK